MPARIFVPLPRPPVFTREGFPLEETRGDWIFPREPRGGAMGSGGRVGATPRGRGCAWQERLERPRGSAAHDMLVCASIQAVRRPRTKL